MCRGFNSLLPHKETNMGRIKTTSIKNLASELMQEHGKKFTEDFEHNKKALSELKKIESKRVRNILAGCITNEVKKVKKSGL